MVNEVYLNLLSVGSLQQQRLESRPNFNKISSCRDKNKTKCVSLSEEDEIPLPNPLNSKCLKFFRTVVCL